MAFTIYSDTGAAHVVSVQTDEHGAFEVVGDIHHRRAVNLGFAQVHVTGAGITQAQRVVGVQNGAHFRVSLLNNGVRIDPVPA